MYKYGASYKVVHGTGIGQEKLLIYQQHTLEYLSMTRFLKSKLRHKLTLLNFGTGDPLVTKAKGK